MAQNVEISFSCIPLRTVGRFDPPLDATEEQRSLSVELHRALNTHGATTPFSFAMADVSSTLLTTQRWRWSNSPSKALC